MVPACTCPGDICPLNFWVSTLKSCDCAADVPDDGRGFSLGSQVVDLSAFPAKGLGLRQPKMSQHAISKLASHLI